MKKRKLSLNVAKRNTESKNLRKAIEELTELSLELLQRLNKPHKNNDKNIVKEIADVKIRLYWLEDKFDKNKVDKAMENKLKLLNKNVNIRRRRNKKSVSTT